MDPVTMAIVGALSNPKTQKLLTKSLTSVFDPNAKLYRKQLKEDRRKYAANDFGKSEAQKNAEMASAMRMQQAGAKDIEASMSRQGGATGFGRSGVASQAQRDLGKDLAGNAAQNRGKMEIANSRLANAEKQQAFARIMARKQENVDNNVAAVQGAGEAAKAAVASAAGAPSGMSIPVSEGGENFATKMDYAMQTGSGAKTPEEYAEDLAKRNQTPSGYAGSGG